MDNHRKTTSQFVKEAQKVHGDKYDYSEVEYVNTHTPIRIKCKQCSVVFLQSPANHLVGRGCPRCSKKQTHKRVNQEMFIARARAVHGDKYDYSKTDYQDMRSKVLIVCPVHGEFWQRAQSHLLGNGCPHVSVTIISDGLQNYRKASWSSKTGTNRETNDVNC